MGRVRVLCMHAGAYRHVNFPIRAAAAPAQGAGSTAGTGRFRMPASFLFLYLSLTRTLTRAHTHARTHAHKITHTLLQGPGRARRGEPRHAQGQLPHCAHQQGRAAAGAAALAARTDRHPAGNSRCAGAGVDAAESL